jgi:hypothetical protein
MRLGIERATLGKHGTHTVLPAEKILSYRDLDRR